MRETTRILERAAEGGGRQGDRVLNVTGPLVVMEAVAGAGDDFAAGSFGEQTIRQAEERVHEMPVRLQAR